MAKGKYQQWIEPEGLLKIEGWARDGLTEKDIARNMGISRDTLNEWKKKYSDISDTLKRGKDVSDRQVENALFRNATGYDYHEITRERIFNKKTGQFELMVTKDVIKHMKPDTTAQIIWLKNRKPEQWSDRPRTQKDEEEQTARIDRMKAEIERISNNGIPEDDGVMIINDV
ncbi:MAG: helix-turn-helix domain-containing protein [Eubacteriales bacterium]|nr:helix-turn-helix domain-containing protein [Eubacteriales bacterium]